MIDKRELFNKNLHKKVPRKLKLNNVLNIMFNIVQWKIEWTIFDRLLNAMTSIIKKYLSSENLTLINFDLLLVPLIVRPLVCLTTPLFNSNNSDLRVEFSSLLFWIKIFLSKSNSLKAKKKRNDDETGSYRIHCILCNFCCFFFKNIKLHFVLLASVVYKVD